MRRLRKCSEIRLHFAADPKLPGPRLDDRKGERWQKLYTDDILRAEQRFEEVLRGVFEEAGSSMEGSWKDIYDRAVDSAKMDESRIAVHTPLVLAEVREYNLNESRSDFRLNQTALSEWLAQGVEKTSLRRLR